MVKKPVENANINRILYQYYKEDGSEKFVKGERWTNKHVKEYVKESRFRGKMILLDQLGFRLSRNEKDMVEDIIRLLDNNFNKVNYTLSNKQVLVMIICFIRMEHDPYNRPVYFDKLDEYGINEQMFVSFLITLLKQYRS